MSTIKDVAAYAGVSVATVSRVLNNKGPLSEKAIVKVNEAIEKLDYHPNILARSLASGKNNTIGVVISSFNDPFWSEIAQEIENSAREKGYHVLYSIAQEQMEQEVAALEELQTRQVSGIIYACGGDKKLTRKILQQCGVPLVSLINAMEGICSVISEDWKGGVLAARHLIAKGCERVIHISGNLGRELSANDRTYAFMEECKKRGIDCRLYENKAGNSAGTDVLRKLINQVFYENPEMDGIFLSNDIMATLCISNAQSQGTRIPDELRIMGYDDIRISSLIYPPLTTIRQDFKLLAQGAVEMLLDQIEGREPSKLLEIPVELVERKTT